MTPYGFIYIITNTLDGMFYVGQTKRAVSYRWSVHKSEARRRPRSHFHKAIRKHGAEVFDVQVAAVAYSREQLLRLEQLWILATGAHKSGYNLTTGGEGACHTQEVIDRIRAKNTGRVASAEARARLSAARRGVPQSAAHRAARSAALKGKQTPTAECRAAVAEANRHRVLSESTRAKLRAAAVKANTVRWGR